MKTQIYTLFLLSLTLTSALAKYPSHVYRHTQMTEAMAEATKKNKPLLLLVTKEKTT